MHTCLYRPWTDCELVELQPENALKSQAVRLPFNFDASFSAFDAWAVFLVISTKLRLLKRQLKIIFTVRVVPEFSFLSSLLHTFHNCSIFDSFCLFQKNSIAVLGVACIILGVGISGPAQTKQVSLGGVTSSSILPCARRIHSGSRQLMHVNSAELSDSV